MTTWILRSIGSLLVGLVLAIGLPAAAPAIRQPHLPGVRAGTPAHVAAYFADLAPDRVVTLVTTDPAAVGNLDGVPIALRYRANARDDGARFAGRQVLGYDPSGPGRVIEVVGDLETAKRIAILVPGSDTTLANFDRGLGGVQRRAPAWQARQLAAAANPDTAVIAWLGYDTPKGLGRDAIRSDVAQSAADALVSFVDGLAAQLPHATTTIIGHSYGSVVVAHAANRLPADVTDLVVIGSPGMDVDRASQLNTTARVWAGSDSTDWTLKIPQIRVLGAGHATNPTEPQFGALRLDVHDAQGHDGYFVPGTVALASIAKVVTQ